MRRFGQIVFAIIVTAIMPFSALSTGQRATAAPAGLGPLVGDWVNAISGQTGTIAHLRVHQAGGRFLAHTYGACSHMTDTWFAGVYPCALGDAEIVARSYAPLTATATYPITRSTYVLQTITAVEGPFGSLKLHVQSELHSPTEAAARVDDLVPLRLPSFAKDWSSGEIGIMAENDGVFIPQGKTCADPTFFFTGMLQGGQALIAADETRGHNYVTYVNSQMHLDYDDPSDILFGNDNQLILLPGNRLLLLWAGWTAADNWGPEKHPYPPFWSSTKPGGKDTPDFQINGAAPKVAGYRGAYFLWESDDCGKNWYGNMATKQAAPSVIDSGLDVIQGEQGGCAWTQGTGKQNTDGTYPTWHPGGWDRPEIYYDPYADKVWIASICVGGTRTGYNHTIPYPGLSPQYGWIVLFSSYGGHPEGFGQTLIQMPTPYAPDYMTSTPDKRLFMFMCYGDTPDLYWLDDGAKTLSGYHNLSYPPGTNFGTAPDDKCTTVSHGSKDPNDPKSTDTVLPNGWNYNAPTLAISRAGSDENFDMVRVAWPQDTTITDTATGKKQYHQVERVVLVAVSKKPGIVGVSSNNTVKTAYTVKIAPITTFAPSTFGSDYIFHAVFVQSSDAGPTENTAMLYWLESSNGQLCAKYSVMRGPVDFTAPRSLSTSCWTPDPGAWLGDYMRGMAWSEGSDLKLLGTWHEAASNGSVHYNVVTVPGS
jgi:hypothetical protein